MGDSGQQAKKSWGKGGKGSFGVGGRRERRMILGPGMGDSGQPRGVGPKGGGKLWGRVKKGDPNGN